MFYMSLWLIILVVSYIQITKILINDVNDFLNIMTKYSSRQLLSFAQNVYKSLLVGMKVLILTHAKP
jgi:hypothetical protein